MDTVHQIQTRIDTAKPGTVFTPKDFLDLANRDVTDKTLSRLVKAGKLQRVGRGLYFLPKRNEKLGVDVPPDLDDVAEAIGRQTGSKVAPSGAVAAIRLGLSTQVPGKPVYLTDGRSRTVRVGKYVLQMKHVPPKELPIGNRTSAIVFQAIRFLGKDAVTDQAIMAIRSALTLAELAQLVADAKYAADWICELVRRTVPSQELREERIAAQSSVGQARLDGPIIEVGKSNPK